MFVKAVARVKRNARDAAVAAAKKRGLDEHGQLARPQTNEGDASADENDAPGSAAGDDERRRRILQLDTDMSAFAAEEAAKRAAMHETDLDEVEDTAGDTTFAPRPRG